MSVTTIALDVHPDAVCAAVDASIRAHPLETGGILIGWREDGVVVVIDAIEVATAVADSHSYVLDNSEATAALQDAMHSIGIPRAGYVGSWHSHPQSSPPSRVDIRTYRRVATVAQGPLGFLVIALGSNREVSLYRSVAARVGRSAEVWHHPRADIKVEESCRD